MNPETIRAIDHYDLVETIGHGGMGTVYKAIDRRTKHPVALKLMHSHLSDQPDFQTRFLTECRAVAALDHPNIIRVYDVALHNSLLYMVMEYLDGGTLRKRLNFHVANSLFFEMREIITVTRQVAQALNYAHSQGIIHRDVKPDNVLLRSHLVGETDIGIRAVLTDFGLAKRIGGAPMTTTGELIGTLAYMAPEQFRDMPVDSRCDLYSLGVMLYELVTGRPPYSSPSAMDMILMHTQGEPERVQDLRPDTPPALISIIHRAMLKNPDDRYETAGEIARELEALEKSIKPSIEVDTWRIRRGTSASNDGPSTVFDVLPALDRPAIPVDLFSEGTDDIIIVTPLEGPSWSLPFEKPSITVGRDPSCDLRLDDPRVSRQHVRIDRLPDGQIAVVDLDSLNGMFMGDEKITKNMMTAWPTAQSVKVGPFWLTLRVAKTPVGQGRRVVTNSPRSVETRSEDRDLTLRITPAETVVEPGSATIVRAEIVNNRDTDQDYTLNIQGIPPEWFTTAPFPLHVATKRSAERLITFHPPRAPTSAAMNYDYLLCIVPQGQERSQASLAGTLRVYPYFAYASDLTVGGRGARITISNQGNSQRFYVVEVRERQNVLVMLPSRSRTLVAPGQSAAIDIRIRAKRRPLFGSSRHYPLEVFIRTDGLRPQTRTLEIPVRPLIPWEVIALLILMIAAFVGVLATLLRG
jgi:serine/threonine protein kinase